MTPVNHDIEPAAAGAVRLLIEARNRDPFALLGPHRDERGGGTVVRAFQPEARSIELRLMATGELRAMEKVDPAGIFEIRLNPTGDTGAGYPDYRLRITFHGDHVSEIDDPYRYGRVLTDFDLHLFAEGTHYRAYDKLGAHRMTIGPTNGVHFAVWAPNAERVSVIGDFNGWDGRVQPMRLLTPTGVFFRRGSRACTASVLGRSIPAPTFPRCGRKRHWPGRCAAAGPGRGRPRQSC